MPPRKQARTERETPNRVEHLGFRLDEETKYLIELPPIYHCAKSATSA